MMRIYLPSLGWQEQTDSFCKQPFMGNQVEGSPLAVAVSQSGGILRIPWSMTAEPL